MSRDYTIFFRLEPEVAGGAGAATVLDSSTHPPRVARLEYHFDGWLGDDLRESSPCYIVTERLKQAIEQADLTGYSFDEVLVTTSATFRELYSNRTLPIGQAQVRRRS
jgi:hypothetical protein